MSRRVLVVDDERNIRAMLEQMLVLADYEVHCVESGEEALECARSGDFDLALLDVQMAGLDGIETLRRLLALNPDLQVILLTGQATIRTGVEAIKEGAVEFLEKPARLEALLERIERARESAAETRKQRVADRVNDILRSKGW